MSLSKDRQARFIELLALERRDRFRCEMRGMLALQSKEIEVQSQAHFVHYVEPLHPERPFGLPASFQDSGINDVWEKILSFIEEDEDVHSLRGICTMFQDLLEEKYRLAKLLKALKICVLHARDLDEDALNFRLANRLTKRLFDKIFTRQGVDEFGYNRRWAYLVPGFDLYLDDTQEDQQHLRRMVASIEKHNFPNGTFALRRLSFDERNIEDLYLEQLRNSVQRLFELAGDNIHFVTYLTKHSSHNAYCILRKWILLLPNLEEITVGVGGEPECLSLPFEPFPRAPHLKTFHEDPLGGLSISHLAEILRACPGIRNLKINHSPENRLEALLSSRVLDRMSLQVFFCIQDRQKPLLESHFTWPLRTLKLGIESGGAEAIPSKTLFEFINGFGSTLEELFVDLDISDNGGMLELPTLTRLYWWLGSATDRFDFTSHLRNLEFFCIFVPEEFANRSSGLKTRTLEYLEKYHVPRLFPATRWIKARTHFEARGCQIIWGNERVGAYRELYDL